MFVILANVSCFESPKNGDAPLNLKLCAHLLAREFKEKVFYSAYSMYVITPMLHMSVAVDIGWY